MAESKGSYMIIPKQCQGRSERTGWKDCRNRKNLKRVTLVLGWGLPKNKRIYHRKYLCPACLEEIPPLKEIQKAKRRPKNEITKRNLCAALTWLNYKITSKGMRGTTEVSLCDGYVADAVALCGFQGEYFEKYTLHKKEKFEFNYFACIFEAKVSRADFLSTFNKSPKHQNRQQPIGSLHWCVTPKGLIRPEELPDFWGLLEEYGCGLTEKRRPIFNILSEQQFDKIAHNLLWAIQAKRNYINCAKCGAFIREGYCSGKCARGDI
jgi:hypothetical protein